MWSVVHMQPRDKLRVAQSVVILKKCVKKLREIQSSCDHTYSTVGHTGSLATTLSFCFLCGFCSKIQKMNF